ncbi:hypothetical protein ACHFJ0_05010 [Paracoccus sp. NGMCC 1.201697]|uniref:Uncharacterized protein n=1 Tax=Paracoccus broussonetiae subsp. drimophilus TaxID=3373869 RepID=A0ABW7LGX2_9RHOB
MALPEFPNLVLRGRPGGEVQVFADGKALGTLFWKDGEFCVALYPQAVRSIGRVAEA